MSNIISLCLSQYQSLPTRVSRIASFDSQLKSPRPSSNRCSSKSWPTLCISSLSAHPTDFCLSPAHYIYKVKLYKSKPSKTTSIRRAVPQPPSQATQPISRDDPTLAQCINCFLSSAQPISRLQRTHRTDRFAPWNIRIITAHGPQSQ